MTSRLLTSVAPPRCDRRERVDSRGSVGDPMAWMVSAEGREFYRLTSIAWGAANEAAGADPAEVATMVANTTQFYAPDAQAPS